MTDNYFLVFELPGGSEMKFKGNGISPNDFWINAANAVRGGTAKIISQRTDTGVAEEVRAYASNLTKFTTLLLLQMAIQPSMANAEKYLFTKAANLISTSVDETIIDSNEIYQLVTIAA